MSLMQARFVLGSMVLASAGSGWAPTTRSTGLPSRRNTSVGIELASNVRATCGLSSTLTLTTLTLPAYLSARRSSTGATMRHGPHQGAQRSTSTNSLVVVTCAKSASVASAIQGRSRLQDAQRGRPVAAAGTRFLV